MDRNVQQKGSEMTALRETDASPTVSVVIPLYNKERYIERALNSVCRLTWRDLDILIIDDGSTCGKASRFFSVVWAQRRSFGLDRTAPLESSDERPQLSLAFAHPARPTHRLAETAT
jgi:cellulose synthase/poly-beta-1,6-N-acetylglucosamine synthase-like glycosyltransferase